MSERIRSAFEARAREGRKALVTYLCVGDPDEATSIELALACAEAGADVLELGCPFSDPTADGPAIARASERSLARGGGLSGTLRVAREIRRRSDVPIVLFGYYNPLFVRGDEAAARLAADAGIDALLVVDLPLEASLPLRTAARDVGLGVVPLVTPTTRPERIAKLRELAERFPVPFAYYVSTRGVTGGSNAHATLEDASLRAKSVRETTTLPTVVGFGIDAPERARVAARDADGVVVGTALVRRVEEATSKADGLASVARFVAELRAAV